MKVRYRSTQPRLSGSPPSSSRRVIRSPLREEELGLAFWTGGGLEGPGGAADAVAVVSVGSKIKKQNKKMRGGEGIAKEEGKRKQVKKVPLAYYLLDNRMKEGWEKRGRQSERKQQHAG
ncbi:hypothetical protein EYF80_037238 [Liparis tanakae]|uniref:Uncharacterized protein n=1 Tax=Liparis tanakae TaxID=230148 RepID=A0A4Z2GH33_9TELE|nr:hypothetical protein EYF80_037238 [Liparis tanakae]